jgi:hypothetical protein
MTITEFAANAARAFMAAEIAMASVNCGAANVSRAQAEKLLGDYFALVEPRFPGPTIIPWTAGPVRAPTATKPSVISTALRNAARYAMRRRLMLQMLEGSDQRNYCCPDHAELDLERGIAAVGPSRRKMS